MRYAPCGNLNLEPFQCEIRAYAWAGTTWATAGARTLEPATFIGMVMTQEKRQPEANAEALTRDTPDLWRIGGGVGRVRVGRIAPGRKEERSGW
jgi:hypothetical protein